MRLRTLVCVRFPSARVWFGPAWLRSRVPPWLRSFWSTTLVRTPAEAAWTVLMTAAPVLSLLWEGASGGRSHVGALVVLAILVEGWVARFSLTLVVLAVAVAAQVGLLLHGGEEPVTVAAWTVTFTAAAVLGQLGALGWASVRDLHQHEMNALMSASHALGGPHDLAGVGVEAVRAAAGTVARPGLAGGRPSALLRLDDERLSIVAACDATGVELPAAGGTDLGLPSAVVRRVLDSGRTAVAAGDHVPAALDHRTGLIAPAAWAFARVQVGGEPFGLLGVASPDPGELRRDDLRLLDGIARVAGMAVAAALRSAELTELKGRLQQSVELALDVGGTLRPADVVAATLVKVADSVGADRATLARFKGPDLVVEATYWPGGGHLVPIGRRFPTASIRAVPSLATAMDTNQPVMNGVLAAAQPGRELASALADGRHTLIFPLVSGGKMRCLLVLARHHDEPFERADLARLEPMTDIALLALRNAHLYTQVERAQLEASTSSRRLQLAIDAAKDIGSSEELGDVLDHVLDRAVAAVGADRGTISRLDGDQMVVEFVHDPAAGEAQAGSAMAMADDPLATEAVRARRPVLGAAPDGQPPEPAAPGATEDVGDPHVIACPLVVRREVVGLLELSRGQERPFGEAELLTLQPFATLAALLLRNARLLAEARQVGEIKSSFLNLAAHELRTPLSVIKGYLSMLEDGTFPVPDRTRDQAVGTLVAKADELESLIEGLLTGARLEVGTLPRAESEFDLREAVEQALVRIAPRVRLEGARVTSDLPEGQVRVTADRGHVGSVLDNLLNNALSYSLSPAEVDVAVSADAGGLGTVTVRDRGIGIAPDHQPRVFERFYRGEGAAARFSPGLGLGLSISRELAELNGGALDLVRSEPGEGSTFALRLPAAAAALATA